jgi:integrative and conjugative element protein (TIGR02256 family)
MREGLIRKNPFILGGKILIEQSVLAEIESFQQTRHDSVEAGGILLGFRRGIHLHITEATTPYSNDIRGRFNFHRKDWLHQKIATEKWKSSNMLIDYLGEWHTHAEKTPSPSNIDYSEWKKIYTKSRDAMVFIILGTSSTTWMGISHESKLLSCEI